MKANECEMYDDADVNDMSHDPLMERLRMRVIELESERDALVSYLVEISAECPPGSRYCECTGDFLLHCPPCWTDSAKERTGLSRRKIGIADENRRELTVIAGRQSMPTSASNVLFGDDLISRQSLPTR